MSLIICILQNKEWRKESQGWGETKKRR